MKAEIFPLPGVVNVLTRLRDIGIRLTVLSTGCLEASDVRQQLVQLGIDALLR